MFGIFGALLAYWIVGLFGSPDCRSRAFSSGNRPRLRGKPSGLDCAATLGFVFGWFLIGPINAGLSVVFKGFNRLFDLITVWYGRAIGRLLRVTVSLW